MIKRYPHADHLLIAVDCIIFGFDKNQLKLLLMKRALEPEKGNWSLIGGFVTKDESLDSAAKRVLSKLTGLKNGCFMNPPRGSGPVLLWKAKWKSSMVCTVRANTSRFWVPAP